MTTMWVLTSEDRGDVGVEVFARRASGEIRLAAVLEEAGFDEEYDDNYEDEDKHVVSLVAGVTYELGKAEVK